MVYTGSRNETQHFATVCCIRQAPETLKCEKVLGSKPYCRAVNMQPKLWHPGNKNLIMWGFLSSTSTAHKSGSFYKQLSKMHFLMKEYTKMSKYIHIRGFCCHLFVVEETRMALSWKYQLCVSSGLKSVCVLNRHLNKYWYI